MILGLLRSYCTKGVKFQAILDSNKVFLLPEQSALLAILSTSSNPDHRALVDHSERTGGIFQLDAGRLPGWALDRLSSEGGAFVAYREFDLTDRIFGKEIFFGVQVAFMINKDRCGNININSFIQIQKDVNFQSLEARL